jgi:hypothetical protein
MLKKFIAPLQKIILQKKLCPGCTRPLSKAKTLGDNDQERLVACECGRIFVLDKELDVYRRAVSDDLKRIS